MPAQTPNVFTYPRNEPGTLGHADLVEPLRTLPRDLIDELRGITAEQTREPSPEGGWGVADIIGHLRDTAEIDHKRLYMMSTQTDPVLEPWDEQASAERRRKSPADLAAMLGELREWRADTVRLLTTLVNWNWARTGRHLEQGRMSIRQMVEYMVDHESQHMSEVRRIRAGQLETGD